LEIKRRSASSLAADAPAAVWSAASGRARRTKRPKAAAGDVFDERRSVLNLRMQARRTGGLNLRGGRNSRDCEHERRSRPGREFSHQILRLMAKGELAAGRRTNGAVLVREAAPRA